MAQNPDQANPIVSLLLKSPLTPNQRRAASEAFSASTNEDDLQERMVALKLPKHVMADLWDMKAASPSQPMEQTQGPEGSALGRFSSNAGEMMNPVTIAKGLWNAAPIPQALGGSGVIEGPMNAATGIISAANDQRLKAHEARERGDYGEMAARSVAAAIPILGPAAVEAGEQIGEGDIAGGLGKGFGIIAPMLLGMARTSPAKNAVKADALRREAEGIVSERVLAPANPRYKVAAQKAAPELLSRGVQGDRVAVQQWADDLISSADQQIDDLATKHATDRLPTAKTLKTLDAAMEKMQFDGPQGPQVNPAFQGAYNELAKQRQFVADRGADMSLADMRRLRQNLDALSKKAGAFSKANGDLSLSAVEDAVMETGNALRDQIATSRPEFAGPNADMHLGLTVRDILDPAKGRPKTASVTTGATGGLHTTAAIIGSTVTKIPGLQTVAAFVASDLIPRIKNAQVSPQNQFRLAQDKFKLAEALKAGKPSVAQGVIRNMSLYVPGLSGVGRITEPSGASQ